MHNKSLLSRVYEYNGSFVTFDKTNDATMVNATQMAKPFKKLTEREKDLILYGSDELINFHFNRIIILEIFVQFPGTAYFTGS